MTELGRRYLKQAKERGEEGISKWSSKRVDEGEKAKDATHLMLIPLRTNNRTFVDEISL